MTYALWSDNTFTTLSKLRRLRKVGVIEEDGKIIFRVNARSWEDAMQAMYTFKEWGRYKPIWESVSGVCWDEHHELCKGLRLDGTKACDCSCHKNNPQGQKTEKD